jgi:hypothetical protein
MYAGRILYWLHSAFPTKADDASEQDDKTQETGSPQATESNDISAPVKAADDEFVTTAMEAGHSGDMCPRLQNTAAGSFSPQLLYILQSSPPTSPTTSQCSKMSSDISKDDDYTPTSKTSSENMSQEPKIVDGPRRILFQDNTRPLPTTPARLPLYERRHVPQTHAMHELGGRLRQPGVLYEGPVATPGDPFGSPAPIHRSNNGNYCRGYVPPSPYTPQHSGNLFMTPRAHVPSTPAILYGASPTPTPYAQQHFYPPITPAHTISSPVANRALSSNNWRTRNGPAVGQNMHQQAPYSPAYSMQPNLSPYSTASYSPPFQQQANYHFGPTYQQGPFAALRNKRQPEPYIIGTNKANFCGYVPSSCHQESDPTLEQIKHTKRFTARPLRYNDEIDRGKSTLSSRTLNLN